VRGDLDDVASMAAGAQGCEVAFHLAAHLGQWGSPEEFERGNVTGTRNALAACEQAGVRRFVHCGTEAALMAGEPLIEADERTPLRPDSPVPYSATKAQAEIEVLAASEEGVFETVAIRPRFVWGVGDTTLLPTIVEQAREGKWAWVAGGRNRTSTTHVDNVVEGLIAGALRGVPGNAYFVLDAGGPVVFRDFVSELMRTQGVEPPSRTVPRFVAGALVTVGQLPRFAFWVATQDCILDDTKAREQLGYAPVKSREEGLAELRGAVREREPAPAGP
jgi:nucleoside-diphosphate-sugar epimerase